MSDENIFQRQLLFSIHQKLIVKTNINLIFCLHQLPHTCMIKFSLRYRINALKIDEDTKQGHEKTHDHLPSSPNTTLMSVISDLLFL